MKKLLILFVFIQTYSFGQSITDFDHSKYWYYRWRLTHLFMHKGEYDYNGLDPIKNKLASGHSLPSNHIMQVINLATGQNYLPEQQWQGIGKINWGDATSYLARYIGVLATEYRLLRNDGQPYNHVLEELYYAMKAYERLDKNSGILQGPKNPAYNNLDGYFVRDDVSPKFVEMYFPNAVPDPLDSPGGPGQKYPDGRPFGSDYIGTNLYNKKDDKQINTQSHAFDIVALCGATWNTQLNEQRCDKYFLSDKAIVEQSVSTDQVAELLAGFALVVKCFEDGVIYVNSQGQTFNFKAKAKEYANHISTYAYNHNYLYPNPATGTLVINGGNVPTDKENTSFNREGAILETQAGCYGTAKGGEAIQKGTFSNNLNVFDNGAYEGAITELYAPAWQAIQTLEGTIVLKLMNNDYVRAYVHSLASVGHSFYSGLYPVKCNTIRIRIPYPCIRGICHKNIYIESWKYKLSYPTPFVYPNILDFLEAALNFKIKIDNCLPIPLPKLTINTTGFILSAQSELFGTELYPLLHQYLYNSGNLFVSRQKYRNFIHSAPCQGPYFFGAGTGVEGWRSDNRWERGKDEASSGGGNKGIFGGLDYMLLYNLYALVEHGDLGVATFENELQREFNNQTISTNKKYYGFESMSFTGNNVINAGQYVSPDINITGNTSFAPGVSLLGTSNGSGIWECEPTGPSYQRVAETNSAPPTSNTIDTVAYRASLENYIKSELQSQYNLDSIKTELDKYKYIPLATYLQNQPLRTNEGNKDKSTENIFSENRVYPNPFANSFTLRFTLTQDETVSFYITDVLGKIKLKVFENKSYKKGTHEFVFDASQLPQGSYYYKLQTKGYVETNHIFKIK
jgi:hypothetical protein